MTAYLQHSLASLAHSLLSPGPGFALRKRLIRQLLPYAVVELFAAQMPHATFKTCLLLNREHKPLGWPVGLKAHLDYLDQDYSGAYCYVDEFALRENLTPITTQHGTFWYLYGHDVPAPWESVEAANLYVEKLCALLDIEGISEDGAVVFQSEAART